MKIKRNYLLLLGWLMILVVVLLSLIPIANQIPDIKNGDKLGHFIAYFTITAWFCLLYQKKWVKNLYAIGFIVMGGILEVLQQMTGYRQFDINDFHMNTIGVIFGFIFGVIMIQVDWVKNIFYPDNNSG